MSYKDCRLANANDKHVEFGNVQRKIIDDLRVVDVLNELAAQRITGAELFVVKALDEYVATAAKFGSILCYDGVGGYWHLVNKIWYKINPVWLRHGMADAASAMGLGLFGKYYGFVNRMIRQLEFMLYVPELKKLVKEASKND